MDIKKIPKDTQSLISASAYINNFTRVIEELVYNSLDAECTSIAIRVSIEENFIQILDNGIGIKKENFCLLGEKYATSKHIDETTLKSAPDKYGYCGLSLASIIEISQEVLISSRFHESEETWLITYNNGTKKELCIATYRPSKGTTVEIRGFLYNLNIQRKSIDNVHELQNIKSSLEQLSLIHCNISVSLRDDYKNEIIFKIHKKRDIYHTLWSLFDISREDVQELQVEKSQYKVKAFISKGNKVKPNQWIYLNGKFVSKTEIHKKVNKVMNKLLSKDNKISKLRNNNDEYIKSDLPFYFIFISCPFCDFHITYKNKQTTVEFKDWTEMDKIIEKLIQFYCGESLLKETVKNKKIKIENTRDQVKQIIEKILNNNSKQSRISNIQHGIKGKNVKRKKNNKNLQIDNDIPLKSQKTKINLKVLNLKDKQGIQNVLNVKNKRDTKKEFKPPSLKDIDRIKYKNKVSSKRIRNIRNVDSLMNKFINLTDSVRKRCEKFSLEAQNILNINAPKKKILKFTSKTEYNEKIYCNNKEAFVTPKNKYDKNLLKNNFELVKVKTSYDLIQPFNQFCKSSTIQEQTEMQGTYSFPPDIEYESLHPKNTYNSHNYQNYSNQWNNLKHFMSTNSRQNFLLQNKKCAISNNNFNTTHSSSFNDIYVRNNANTKQVSYSGNRIKSDQETEVNNSHLHKYEESDNHLDIINRSDSLDKQSLITSDFDNDTYSVEGENELNKTYSVHLPNNVSQYFNFSTNLTTIVENTKHVQSNAKSTIIAESPNNTICLSDSMDPLNYCEIIFKSNEMKDIVKDVINSFTNNEEKNESFNDELLNEGSNKNSNANFLQNTITKYEDCGFEDMNLKLPNTDLNIRTRNNFSRDEKAFQLKKRQDLIPKGMSQIYKTGLKNYDTSSTKIDYYENAVYNNFANDVLLNTEIFSPTLQNVDVRSRKFEKTNRRDDSNLIFNASSLKEAKVLGQIDRKFIATEIKGISSDSSLNFLVLFDQHAVDERIRLETNLSDYFDGNVWSSVTLDSIPLKLDKNDLIYLYNHKSKFIQFGLECAFLDDNILINSIPKAIFGKNQRQEDVVLKAVRRLILEEIDVMKSISGNVNLYPKAIMDMVFSEACRYAIKFGDKLSKSECVLMLKMLSTCKTPFQCAHGRPVMAVLIDLPRSVRNYEVNLENIKRFKLRKSV